MALLLKALLAADKIIRECTFFARVHTQVSEEHFVTDARYGCSHACALGRSGAITIYPLQRRRRIFSVTFSSRGVALFFFFFFLFSFTFFFFLAATGNLRAWE